MPVWPRVAHPRPASFLVASPCAETWEFAATPRLPDRLHSLEHVITLLRELLLQALPCSPLQTQLARRYFLPLLVSSGLAAGRCNGLGHVLRRPMVLALRVHRRGSTLDTTCHRCYN